MTMTSRWVVVIATSVTLGCGGRSCSSTSSTPQGSASNTNAAVTAPAGAETMTPDQIGVVLQAAEVLAKEVPRETFDPAAIVTSLDSDPERILQWVRTNTRWVAYRGALRGPVGVLMDRMGNSLDRSLLLAVLLRQTGATVRLAHGRLSEQLARSVSGGAGAEPAVPSPSARTEQIDAQLNRVAEAFQLDAGKIRSDVQRTSARTSQIAELAGRLETQTPILVDAVGPPRSADNESQQILAAAADHWWVQRQQNDRWVDVDPALTGKGDQGPIRAEQTFPIEAPLSTIPLPSEFTHEITVRVVIEKLLERRLTRKTALEYKFKPAEIFGEPIVLQHAALNWPGNAEIVKAPDPMAQLKRAATEQSEWLPFLTIGDKTFRQSSFTDTGDLNDQPGKGKPRAADSAADALGGGSDDAPPAGQLVAEWIEYETHVPGADAVVVRREMFAEPSIDDLARSRRALSLLGRIEILPVVCRLSRPWVQMQRLAVLLQNQEALTGLTTAMSAHNLDAAIENAGRIRPIANELLDLALARFDWSWMGGDVYLDKPNILTFRDHIVDDGARLTLRRGIDIVSNSIGVKQTSRLRPFYARLVQGVIDTNVEALILGNPSVGNAGALLTATPTKDEWITLRRAEELAAAGSQWPSQFRDRVEQALRTGHTVVAPRQAKSGPAAGFWAVDSKTGDTLGIGGLGWGQALVEYSAAHAVVGVALWFGACAVVGMGPNHPLLTLTVCIVPAGLWGMVSAILADPAIPPAPPPPPPDYFRLGLCGRVMCR